MDRFLLKKESKEADAISDDEEFIALLKPKKLRSQNAPKREYSFQDLKKFSDTAAQAGSKLASWKQSVKEVRTRSLDVSDSDEKVKEADRLINETDRAFSSALSQFYPGERITATRALLSPNVKNSVHIIADHEKGLAEEALFSAVAFSSSNEELIRAKTALRRILASKSYRFIPKLDQFLAILLTAFGADLSRLFPSSQGGGFIGRASAYAQFNFVQSKAKRKKESLCQPPIKSLENLDALLDILSWLDWETVPAKDGNKSAWIRVLLGLSLEIERRNGFDFQVSIGKCLQRMADAATKRESTWKTFREDVRSAVIEGVEGPRHHHNMVHLCSQLPVGTGQYAELRASVALECISIILGNGDSSDCSFDSGVVARLIALLEQGRGESSGVLQEAYSLNSLLRLVQFALIPTAVRSASAEEAECLADIFRAISQGRFHNSSATSSKRAGISLVDSARIRCMINVIVDGKLKTYRAAAGLFHFPSNQFEGDQASNGEDNAADDEDTFYQEQSEEDDSSESREDV